MLSLSYLDFSETYPSNNLLEFKKTKAVCSKPKLDFSTRHFGNKIHLLQLLKL